MGPGVKVSGSERRAGMGWLKVIGLIPVPLFIALIIAQAILGSSAVFEPSYLLSTLDILLIIPFAVAFLCWRGYVSTGAIRILLIGCGMIALGFSGLVAGFATTFPSGLNVSAIIYNTGALIAALFIAPASLLAVRHRKPYTSPEHGRVYAAAAYMSTLILITLCIIAALRGWMPPFFLQDSGFTLLRMAVLGTAMALFALSSILFLISFARWSGFAYWFGLGLTLITIGLIAALLAKAIGTPLGWTSRAARYIGCLYMLIGILTSVRLSHLERVPIVDEIVNSFTRSPINYNKLTKKQLAKLLERHLDLFENSGTGIVIIDKDGRFLMANNRVAASFKKTISEIIGLSLYDFLPRETADRYVELNSQLLRTGGHREYVDTFVLPTGERSFLMVDTCLKDESGKNFAVQHSSIDITEKRRAEEALKKSEERFRNIFDNSAIGKSITSNDGTVNANQALADMLGYKKEELLHVKWQDITYPEDIDETNRKIEALQAGRESSVRYKKRYIKKDNSILWGDVSSVLQKDNGGAALYYITTVVDITAQKQAEEALKQSEEKFKTLTEKTIAGIYIIQDAKMAYVNPSFAKTFGYSLDEITGKLGPQDLIHPDDIQALTRRLQERMEGKTESSNIVYKGLKKDGSLIYIEVYGMLVNYQGKTAVMGTVIDITEKRRVEQALQESELRYRDLFNSTKNGVVVYEAASDGEDFTIKDFNCAAERIENVKKEDIIDKSVLHAFPGVKEFGLFDVLQRVWRTGVPEPHPITQYRDGRISGWRDNYVYRLSSGEIVAIYNDVTERKQAEAEIVHLASFPENNPNPIIEINLDSKISYMNPVARLLFPDMASLGMSHPFLSGAEDLLKAVRDGKTHTMIRQVKIADTWWEETVYLDLSRDNMRFYGTDITERKLAEEKLRESEEKFRSLSETSISGVFANQEKFIYTNPSFQSWTGYTDAELQSMNFWDCVTPDFFNLVRQRGEARLRGERVPDHYETKLLRKDGSERWIDIAVTMTKLAGIPTVIGIAVDITDRKKVEEALKKSEERFKNMASLLPQVIFEADEKSNFTFVNRQGLEIFGYSEAEAAGMNVLETIIPQDRSRAMENIGARIKGQNSPSNEYTAVRKDGSKFPVTIYASPIMLNSRYAGMRGILVDITERKNIEIELQASHEEMRALAGNLQMSMEAERKRIARMIHDDLGQTLTALQIDLSVLAKKLPSDHKQLSAKAAAMDKLITLMDEKVKHITTELRPPLLDELGLCAAVELSLHEFSKRTGIRHEAHYDPEDFTLDTDIAIALFRVLQESLTNITRHSAADMVTMHLKKLQDCISLQIKDNGKGIEKRELANKKSIGIIGMRERVASFGGKMRITSPQDGGTVIDVKIPLAQEVTP